MGKSKSKKKKENGIYLRERKLPNGRKSLYLDLYDGGKRQREFLKLYLLPGKTQEVKDQNKATKLAAEKIQAERTKAHIERGCGLAASKGAKMKLLEYMKGMADDYEKQGSTPSAKSMKGAINHLKAYRGDSITLKEVDKPYLLGFIAFLRNKDSKRSIGNKISPASQTLYFTNLSMAMNRAVREKLIPSNPVNELERKDRPSQGNNTKEHLTLEEVKKLAATDCAYPEIKRAFLFACFAGLRLSDIRALTWNKIRTGDDGKKQVEMKQKKTGEPIYLPLSENALRWLPAQVGAKATDKVFKLGDTSTVERHLRRWAQEAGMTKHVTFHVSRHTAATLLLTFGADIYTVSGVLGHTSVRTTQIYAKIVNAKKRNAVELVPTI